MNGSNFLIQTESGLEKHGFFQNIFIESENSESAEDKAVEIIRNSDIREIVKNKPDDPPMIYLEEITELENFDGVEQLIQGRSFYLESREEELSESELKEIDCKLLENITFQWRKVAMVVATTMIDFKDNFTDISDSFFAERVKMLAEQGIIESQGDLDYMRYSEVRKTQHIDSKNNKVLTSAR